MNKKKRIVMLKNVLFILFAFVTTVTHAEVTYYHTDLVGSPAVITDEDGAVVSRSHYKPFGDSIEGVQQDVGYTGHQHDAELGLTYMQARYYDPVIGRFYSNDPVGALGHLSQGNVQGFNRYTYANGNPYKYIDPNGESAVLATKAWIATDVAVPEPSDAAWPKWAGYVVLLGSAYAIDSIVYNESSKGGEDWEADYEDWANGNSDDVTDHGKERDGRGVDKETTRKNGEKFRDTQSGGTVYVDGPNVVIDGEEGNVTSWGDQTEQETSNKVSQGIWDPIDEE